MGVATMAAAVTVRLCRPLAVVAPMRTLGCGRAALSTAADTAAAATLRPAPAVRRQAAATSLFLARHTLEHLTGHNPSVELNKDLQARIEPSVRAIDNALKLENLNDALSERVGSGTFLDNITTRPGR